LCQIGYIIGNTLYKDEEIEQEQEEEYKEQEEEEENDDDDDDNNKVEVYRGSSRGYSGRGVDLTTRHHPVPSLRMSGAIPLLPLYSFTVWTRKSYLFFIIEDDEEA
jgi:hypothetical protein